MLVNMIRKSIKFFLSIKQACTFILETAHNVCRRHSSAVVGKSVVQLQHVFWCLLVSAERPVLGLQICEVQCGQKLAQKVLCIKERIITHIPIDGCPAMTLRRPDGIAQAQISRHQKQDSQKLNEPEAGEN